MQMAETVRAVDLSQHQQLIDALVQCPVHGFFVPAAVKHIRIPVRLRKIPAHLADHLPLAVHIPEILLGRHMAF